MATGNHRNPRSVRYLTPEQRALMRARSGRRAPSEIDFPERPSESCSKVNNFLGNERAFTLQILAVLQASDAPLPASENATSASYEVEDEDDQRNY
jgi:hypothetical protein